MVAPVSQNATTYKFFTAALLPLIIIAGIFSDFLHSVEAALSRLELENRVDDESAAKLVVHSGSLEAVHDLHPLLRHVNEVVDIKELRSLANLFETGVAESLFYNNVDQALMNRVLVVDKISAQTKTLHLASVDHDGILGTTEASLDRYVLSQLLEHVD